MKKGAKRGLRAPQQPGEHALTKRPARTWLERGQAPFDRDHATEHFRGSHRRILALQRVPPRDPHVLTSYPVLPNHAVRPQTPVSSEEHHLPRQRFDAAPPLHRKHVSRPHSGQHARTRNAKPQLTKSMDELRRQLALDRLAESACVLLGGRASSSAG